MHACTFWSATWVQFLYDVKENKMNYFLDTALIPECAHWLILLHIYWTLMLLQVNSQQWTFILWCVLIFQTLGRWSARSSSPDYFVFLWSFLRQITNQFIYKWSSFQIYTPWVQTELFKSKRCFKWGLSNADYLFHALKVLVLTVLCEYAVCTSSYMYLLNM